ncbi:MAG: PBP1A family penicillin-binding protein [Acidobacteriota bacterium]|nr:PBP1A family penicillin-binding protein [Acidobacteriota bacterium]
MASTPPGSSVGGSTEAGSSVTDRIPQKTLEKRRRPRRSRREGRGWYGRLSPRYRYLLPVLVAVVVGTLFGVAVAAAINIPEVDDLSTFTPSLITRVYSEQGEPFAEFARQRRILLREGEVPEVLQNAIIALEDASFFRHGGVDAVGIARAAITNLRAGEKKEGASTLTMQLARALYLTREKSWRRKIEEAFTAVELEKRFSKQQLLTLYSNLMNLGHGNYGMAQASRYYFDKPVAELELHEAAMLAGILQRPSDYSPYRRPDLVRQRRNWTLSRMLAEDFITREEYDEAVTQPLGVVRQRQREQFAPYFAEEVRQDIENTYGTTAMLEGGLRVYSTLDQRIQASAEAALHEGLLELDHRKGWRGPIRQLEEDPQTVELEAWTEGEPEPGAWFQGVVLESDRRTAQVRIGEQVYELTREGMEWTRRSQPRQVLKKGDVAWFRLEAPEAEAAEEEGAEPRLMLEQEPVIEGAALVLESATGAVRAMVGGWDFQRSRFNRAVQAERQVGSAFKPFVWGAALEAGYTAADTLFDAPTYFLGADNQPDYKPRNYGREYYGIITLRRALEKSLNMTAVKLQDLIGVEQTIDFAKRCGVSVELPPYASLALGVTEMTPLELAGAYAAIANQGTFVEPYFIERVESRNGLSLDEHQPATRHATSPEVAFVLSSILEGVVDRGTATALRELPLDLAGKTGTTDDFSDAWFVGFTPRYTVLSWVGYDQRRSLGRGMTGAEAAIPIWKKMIEDGLERGWLEPEERFSPPPGVTTASVEYYSGLLAAPGAERVIQETFVIGTEPAKSWDPTLARIMELPWYQQRPFYIPKEGERMPEDFADVARQKREEELAEGG